MVLLQSLNLDFQLLHIMDISRIINFILIIAGIGIALYAQSQDDGDSYILIAGIILLMMGLYRISRNIPSKFESQDVESNSDEEE